MGRTVMRGPFCFSRKRVLVLATNKSHECDKYTRAKHCYSHAVEVETADTSLSEHGHDSSSKYRSYDTNDDIP